MSTTETRQQLPTGTWRADPVHSEVGFAVDYMAGTFRGTFSRFEVEATGGMLRGSAEVASIQVKDAALEAHLQTPDFFDAELHPRLTFESHQIGRDGDAIEITGELTLKGHTEPVDLQGRVTEPAADPFGGERFGLRLMATIDRRQFGLAWNNPLPNGEPALADQVTLSAELQLVRAD